MTHINNVFKKSFRFIDVEEVQKKSVHIIDDSFARRHNVNKVQHSETQALIKRSIWHYSQIQQTSRHNDNLTY